ncbi:MAG: HIT domain-containing protein [bacterium]
MACVFCKIIAREEPAKVFYEDDEVIVFHDHRPSAPVHLLICPKEHYDNFRAAPPEVHTKLAATVQKIAEMLGEQGKNFRLIINNGSGWGQIVFHLHYHFLAGKR